MRTASYLCALVLVAASGVASGVWRGRWLPPEAFADRVSALDRIPLKVGDWEGRDTGLDARVIKAAGVAGGIVRRYENPRFGALTVMIVCGKPGPVSVHRPEVCYPGAGYAQSGETTKFNLKAGPTGSPASFWTAEFGKATAAAGDRLRVLYAWSDGKDWKASTNPRRDFAGAAALYKLYVVRPLPARSDAAPPDEPYVDFVRDLLAGIGTLQLAAR